MYALGIDLGTTYTAAARWEVDRAETVPLGVRSAVVPSLVWVSHDGQVLVGEAAARRAATSPGQVAREFKRGFGDPTPMLLDGTGVSRTALTTELLRWTLGRVTELEGEPPARVVLTKPATWSAHREQLLLQVAVDAGLDADDVTLLPEPAAAGIFYASRQRVPVGALVGVYDLGGGTFDATVLRKTSGGFEISGVPDGDEWLGGIDLDHQLQRQVDARLAGLLSEQDRTNPAVRTALAQLHAAVVDAKEALSDDQEAVVPVLLPGVSRELVVTRPELAGLVRPLLAQTVDVFERALDQAGVAADDLHAVLLVGGASRMPAVSDLLGERLGRQLSVDAHPKFAVSLGAAVAAGALLATAPDLVRSAAPPDLVPSAAPSVRVVEPEPAAAAPEPEPVVTLQVDLADMGLDDASTVPLAPAVSSTRRRPPVVAAPEEFSTREGAEYGNQARRRSLVLAGSLLALVVLLAVLAAVLR
jgi:molecular chaperone DnaK (HSP70)